MINGKIICKHMIFVSIVIVILMFGISFPASASKKTNPIITSYMDLKSALQSANDGDTLYVGDIDFTPPGNMASSLMSLKITKNLVIKNGKSDGKAIFKNGSFILSGSKINSEKINVSFYDIAFNGGIDTLNLDFSDFESYNLLNELEKGHHAIRPLGNVDVSFNSCDFQNYMNEYGPIMDVRYGDYTSNVRLLELFGDYSTCMLNMNFNECNIFDNAAGYGGGAIFIDGNNNVTMNAKNCNFFNNRSSGHEYSLGGGAIYANKAKVILEQCRVENNIGNYVYPNMPLSELDSNRGGGLYIDNAKIVLKDSKIIGNIASMGGGIALTNVDAEIDGCVFYKNRAETIVESAEGDTGPWTNMSQGGAIYSEGINGGRTTIINCSIYNNSAKTAYGGIYTYYTDAYELVDAIYLDIIFCNYVGNTCDAKYDYDVASDEILPWCTHPGDIWSIPFVTTKGSIIVDETFVGKFQKHELPTESNHYNYFATPEQAEVDNIEFSYQNQPDHIFVKTSDSIDFSIPIEYTKALLNGRYNKNIKEFKVGCNYNALHYTYKKPSNNVMLFVIVGCGIVLIATFVIGAFYVKNQKFTNEERLDNNTSNNNDQDTNYSIEPEKQIIKAWFTDSEIDTIFNAYPKIQTLTGRETEVLREILEGKKQKEIAYNLGIEITTVKDFYRKIYDKLDFANKDDLLKKFSKIILK